MAHIKKFKFTSISDFLKKTGALFKGPTFISTFICMDGAFRERLIITVSIANSCDG